MTTFSSPLTGRVAVLVALVALGALAACGDEGPGGAPPTVPSNPSLSPPTVEGAAAAFCTTSGGSVEARQPYLNTNLDRSSWVRLPGELELCRFESDDEDSSRLYVDTASLAATTASLADAAYLAKLPLPPTVGGGNPATTGCIDNVGGAAAFGTTVNGGGWVNLDDPVFTVVDMCVFADGSAIDQWAIAYYAGGITRGADLATLFRFDTTAAARIYAARSHPSSVSTSSPTETP